MSDTYSGPVYLQMLWNTAMNNTDMAPVLMEPTEGRQANKIIPDSEET